MILQKAKEKVQSAPKELLRRGLLDGTEKIYGQLRDTAQGGQREDTAADRMQGTTERGARLAVDRLGRMRLGKKKGEGQSSDVPPESAPPIIWWSGVTRPGHRTSTNQNAGCCSGFPRQSVWREWPYRSARIRPALGENKGGIHPPSNGCLW